MNRDFLHGNVMERAYAPEGPSQGEILLDKDEAHHLTRVRRVPVGAQIVAFDGQGSAWVCRLTDAGKSHATLRTEQQIAEGGERNGPELCLAAAVPKGDRFDWIVEKATELGVDRLIPLTCERSVVEPRATKLDRLRRAVVEACKQCGRNRLMEIDDLMPLDTLLASLGPNDLGLFADQGGVAAATCFDAANLPARVIVGIGPEGGWTERERTSARNAGWRSIGLGPHILRIETAALAAAVAVRQALMR
jgi:16S rRNA (uracil1498-N3)-methyltransferase